MSFSDGLQKIDITIYILKIFFISLGTYYSVLKNTNIEKFKLRNLILMLFITVLCGIIKYKTNSLNAMICIVFLLSIIFAQFKKSNLGYYFLVTIICFCINYVLFLLGAAISYFPNSIFNIKSNFVSLLSIVIIYYILIYMFFRIKKFRKGFAFLKEKLINDYHDILILNISINILFVIIIISNYKEKITGGLGVGLILSSIIMFITIQKSLQLYYKQKLLIQNLEETKKELEDKKQEVEKLEEENLNFSKISHSIAHKQKSLEYKLNELMLKNEIASEIDIKDRIDAISKELKPKETVKLDKTEIPQIDDMLKYMRSECINNKIEFELQISGNIHQMVNNHIGKDDLEILLADHIKNAIIAINYSDNSNKSILVRLGIIDGCYSLYIYDSGIEFEINTLEKLGKVPSTTHKESGGTGMGFMNTFDTLKKYKASMILNEYGQPSKDNYTKVLMIKFDKKNEYEIKSYRSQEIEKKFNSQDINVEKLIMNKN